MSLLVDDPHCFEWNDTSSYRLRQTEWKLELLRSYTIFFWIERFYFNDVFIKLRRKFRLKGTVLQKMDKTALRQPARKKFVVSVEGNIGSGKSTFLSHFASCSDAEIHHVSASVRVSYSSIPQWGAVRTVTESGPTRFPDRPSRPYRSGGRNLVHFDIKNPRFGDLLMDLHIRRIRRVQEGALLSIELNDTAGSFYLSTRSVVFFFKECPSCLFPPTRRSLCRGGATSTATTCSRCSTRTRKSGASPSSRWCNWRGFK